MLVVSLFCLLQSVCGQWSVIDTFAWHPQWLYPVDYQLRPADDGTLYFFYTDDPPSPSTEAELRIFKTLNDGADWSSVLSYYDYSFFGYDLEFPHPDTGFFTFNYMSNTNLVRTTNGGGAWDPVNYVDGPRDVCFISGLKGYGVDGNKFMRYGNGTMLVDVTLETYTFGARVAFDHNSTGFMIYTDDYALPVHKVQRSLDDGDSWEVVLEDADLTFYDIDSPHEAVCYIACSGGLLYRTIDAGNSWELISTGSASAIRSISFLDGETGYALDAAHVVHRTGDGGVTWSAQGLPAYISEVKRIEMINDSIGYIHGAIAGYDQLEVLLKTTSGGMVGIVDQEVSNIRFDVYPVPCRDNLLISFGEEVHEGLIIELTDMAGRPVLRRESLPESPVILNLAGLDPGLYLLKVNNLYTERVLKL